MERALALSYRVAGWLALAGGGVVLCALSVSAASIVGRTLFHSPLAGEYELVERATAVAAAWFLPYAERLRANVFIDFFTNGLSSSLRCRLEGIGLLVVALVVALLSAMACIGTLDLWRSGEISMNLGVPQYLVAAAMLPGLMLFSAMLFLHGLARWQARPLEASDDPA